MLITAEQYTEITGADAPDNFTTLEATTVRLLEAALRRQVAAGEVVELLEVWDGYAFPTATPITAVTSDEAQYGGVWEEVTFAGFDDDSIEIGARDGARARVTYTGGYAELGAVPATVGRSPPRHLIRDASTIVSAVVSESPDFDELDWVNRETDVRRLTQQVRDGAVDLDSRAQSIRQTTDEIRAALRLRGHGAEIQKLPYPIDPKAIEEASANAFRVVSKADDLQHVVAGLAAAIERITELDERRRAEELEEMARNRKHARLGAVVGIVGVMAAIASVIVAIIAL